MSLMQRTVGDLKLMEGFRAKPYKDTRGILTIGYGRNLDDVGITQEEGNFMLYNDVQDRIVDLRRVLPYFDSLDEARESALLNLAYNIGTVGVLGFKNMLAALAAGDFAAAASELVDSEWAKQVQPYRRDRLEEMIRNGQ